MKKFRLWLWGMVALNVVFTGIMVMVAPQTVVMHFNASGAADSFSGKAGLWLAAVIILVIALICQLVANAQRKRAGLSGLPVILFGEWRLLALVAVSAVVMALLQMHQIGFM